MTNLLFNTKRLNAQKEQVFKKGPPDLFLHAWVEDQIIKRYNNLSQGDLTVCSGFLVHKTQNFQVNSFLLNQTQSVIDPLNLPFRQASIDVFLDSMQIHVVNDVVGYLQEIQKTLKKEGIYLLGFLGGDSAKALRSHFLDLEAQHYGTGTLRLAPVISPEVMGGLLQKVGFKDIVIERLELKIQYDCFKNFVRDIRQAGENHALNRQAFSYHPLVWQGIERDWHQWMPLPLEIIIVTARN